MAHDFTATFIGFAGVSLLLLAFLLNLIKLMRTDGYSYTSLNFVGAARPAGSALAWRARFDNLRC